MAKVDVTDEAVLEGSPQTVYDTFLNELSGITQWWMPHLKCRSRKGNLLCGEGDIFDATIHPESRLKVQVSCKITKLAEAKSIGIEYAGDFVGTGDYTFEPSDKWTKVRFRFNVKTHNPLMSFLASFANLSKAHSEVMQQGFKGANRHLKQT